MFIKCYSPWAAGIHRDALRVALLREDSSICGLAQLADTIHAPRPSLLAVVASLDGIHILLPQLRHFIR